MILTVTPNPALDLTWHAPAVRLGETHRVPVGVGRAGGKGLNVARVLHSQAHDVLALTTVGGETGAEFATELRASGVPHEFVPFAGATRRSLAIVDESAGSVSVFNELGDPLEGAESARFWSRVRELGKTASVVAMSGSLPAGDANEMLPDAVRAIVATGTPVLVDTSGPAMLDVASAGATVLKPNREELADATGEHDPVIAARLLLERGATAVLASLGESGLFIVHRDGRGVRAMFNRVVHGNATGAGDAVSAAIALSLSTDPTLSAPDALDVLATRAAVWGAAAVASPLAGDIDNSIAADTTSVTVTALEESF